MTRRLSSTRYSKPLRQFSSHARNFIKKLGCKQNENLHFILVHDAKQKNLGFSPSSNYPAMTLHKPLKLLEKLTPRITLFSKNNDLIHVFSQNKKGYAVFLEINYRETRKSDFKKIRAQFIDVDLNKISEHFHTSEQVQQRIESLQSDPSEQILSITIKRNKQGLYHLLAQRTKERVAILKKEFIKKYRRRIKDTMIIETKNGYHIYWVLQGGSINKFVPIQKALAQKFSSDPMITNLSRVMRIPGFYHMKNPESPYMVRAIQWGRKKPFTQNELIRSLALKPLFTAKSRQKPR
ncbi:DNA-primase RepB domain-containing protein [Paenibacillus sp. LHD-38]|uniref:DNA-primase RepB domain-containing protein n=1 Tax=Paenibacillus sp. LHD-38 TaxID=3072143 RepID=UPI00280F3968|nr:DNA-primase RepB domain-containing protein [Paenibacillus sp. LHD-38]MDQ8735031.1 DNA-primase RepB domain-containing protein [Paenibacillus sp. LHD-38]